MIDESGDFPWRGIAPAPGRLLLAAPSLTESTFVRTVIYLLEHDGGGTVGVILNRPTRTPVGTVLPEWHDAISEPPVIFTGGPVQPDSALCIAAVPGSTAASPQSVRLVDGGLGTVDLDADVSVVTGMTSALRVFAGHAGWASGQLAEELERGAWYVLESLAGDVFDPQPKELWRTVLRRQPPPLRLVSSYPGELGLN